MKYYLRRSLKAVIHRRQPLRIPDAFRQRRLWTPREDRILVTMNNPQAAARLGWTLMAVKVRRELVRSRRAANGKA